MNTLLAPRALAAPGLLALLYLCLCFAPLGSGVPFSVVSLHLWALAIAVLLAAALGQMLVPWRLAPWVLALGVAGQVLGSPVLFPDLSFHLLALSSGLLLVLAIAASQARRPLQAGLWLLSALLSWRYMQPHSLDDTDALGAAIDAYGKPLLAASLVAHLALLSRFGHGLARALNRAFLLALGVVLFSHLTGLLPLGNARQWLWLVAMSLVIDALLVAMLLAAPRPALRWAGRGLLALLACQVLGTATAPGVPGTDSLYQYLSALPPSEVLVQHWAQASVARYRDLDPSLSRHRFVQEEQLPSLFHPRHAQAFYLLGAPLDLTRNPSGLDPTLQQQVDRYRCRYTWQAAITDAGVLRLSCG